MKRTLGIGVIGCGVISDIYLRRMADFEQLRLVAVADLHPDAAKTRAEHYGCPALTSDALLSHDDVEIVLNLTIPAAHADVSLAAIAAGKHVYSEKPITATAQDAARVLDAAQAAGVRVGCAPDTFLGGAHQTARAAIDAGRIGRPTSGTATLMVGGHERWHPNPDFYYAKAGGGPLMDMGPYYITAMVNFLGPVARVTALAGAARTERTIATGPRAGATVPVETPTHIAGVMEFESGALIQIVTSFDVAAHGHAPLELYGTEGSITIPDPNRFDGTSRLFRDGAWQDLPPAFAYGDDNWRGLGLADMADAIIEGRPHRASGDLARHVLCVIEALLASAADSRVVEVSHTCARPAPYAKEMA